MARKRESVLKAIAEPRRRQILELLRDAGGLSVGELTALVDVTQQAVSLHLKVLDEAGLVEARREGTRHVYVVKAEGFQPVHDFVAEFWPGSLAALKASVEKK